MRRDRASLDLKQIYQSLCLNAGGGLWHQIEPPRWEADHLELRQHGYL